MKPHHADGYGAVQTWVELFGMDGLIIRWSPAPLWKGMLISCGALAGVWGASFLFFGTVMPAWLHCTFAALTLLPFVIFLPKIARGSKQPVWLELDVHARRLDLPLAARSIALDDYGVGFFHDYFRFPGAPFNKSEFNIELTPRSEGAPELVPVLRFAGYREAFDKLGERLRLLGFPFQIRKHELEP